MSNYPVVSLDSDVWSIEEVYALIDRMRALEGAQKRLQVAVWASGDTVWEWLADGDEFLIDAFDADRQQLSRQRLPFLDLIAEMHSDDTSAFWLAWNTHLLGKSDAMEVQYRIRVDGEWAWQRMRGRATERNPAGIAWRISGMRKDISGERAQEESLQLLSAALGDTADALMVLSTDLTVLQINETFTKLCGYAMHDIVGDHPSKILAIQPQEGEVFEWSKLAEFDRWYGEATLLREDGQKIPTEISCQTIRDSASRATHLVAVLRDISERHRAAQTLETLARQDPLTHLPNRLALQETLTTWLQERDAHTRVEVLFIDLDGFKEINDALGHGAGDALLMDVATRIAAVLGKDDVLARWGGDEYVVVLRVPLAEPRAETLAKTLLALLNKPTQIAGHEITVTPSIGIVAAPEHGEDAYLLLRHADTAMYAAKRGGRNRYAMYAPNMNAGMLERVKLLTALRRAVDNGEFTTVLQPKVRLGDRKIVGAEMLMRWHSEQFGRVSPASFIPLAEEHGLIIPVGRWLMQQAADVLQHWFRIDPGLSLAVNLSARQLRDDRLLAPFLPVGPHCTRLELEVTESALLDDADFACARLSELRHTGLSVALDDFGTGYSSLSYLKVLPLDHVKIDRSFIAGIDETRRGRALLASIAHLCRSLGYLTTAEGVETAEQLAIVQELGIDQVQGYFFSPPVPHREFDQLLINGLPAPKA